MQSLRHARRVAQRAARRERRHHMKALSASQLKTFASCPARWGAIYLNGGVREPETPATALGQLVHAQLEAWVKYGRDR